MVLKGPMRVKLEHYLDGADFAGINSSVQGLNYYRLALMDAADLLNQAAAVISGGAAGDGQLSGLTFQSAGGAFARSSTDMQDNADFVQPAAPAVIVSAATISQARTALGAMADVPDPPGATDPLLEGEEAVRANATRQAAINQQQADLAAQEEQAAQHVTDIDQNYAVAVEEMKKIHGVPDPPAPVASGAGTPERPGGSDVVSGQRFEVVEDIDDDDDDGVVTRPPRPVFPPPVLIVDPLESEIVVTDGPGATTTDAVGPPTTSPGTGATMTGGGAGTVGTGTGTGAGSGASSGVATAGLIGGVGVGAGGLGAMLGTALSGKGAIPGLSGKSGAIGASSRAAGSAVTGRSTGTGAGARAGAGAGRAGASGAGPVGKGSVGKGSASKGSAGKGSVGKGSAGRAGAGTGAAGKSAAGKGAAGSRGIGGRGVGRGSARAAGAGAGRAEAGRAGSGAAGAGRGSKKDRDQGRVWEQVEDRDQWIDDEGVARSVID